MVSLSRPIHPGIHQWPNDPPIEFEAAASLEDDDYNLRRFSMGEHSGTHINAPNSFHDSGYSIDQIPAESLVVPACVIDVREQAAAYRDYALTVGDLQDWERRYGQVTAGSMVLLHTGWQPETDSPPEDAEPSGSHRLNFPGYGYEAARCLLFERHAAGVGTDTLGVEPGNDSAFSVNKLTLEQGRIVVENLTNLERLPPTGATLVIGVLPLTEGTGSPAAVLAFIP